MILRQWLRANGVLVAFAVILICACATTVSVAMRLNRASYLEARTEQLSARVAAEQEPPTQAAEQSEDPQAEERESRRSRRGGRRSSVDLTDPAQVAALRIERRNLFTNPPSPQFRNVIGVLGNYVLYPDGDMLAVGDQREGATITAVGADYVEFEFEGQTVRVDVLDAAGRQGGGSGGGEERSNRFRRDGGARTFGGRGGPPSTDSAPSGSTDGEDPRAALRQRMIERFGDPREMTPEQIEELREQFRSQRRRRSD